ncbi:hypothetical protein [Streptomyces sp. NPDC049585]|uniref:hypothetical protein n=1 Tax=Streptomyces sp. NPDC049585 TaxID=3155154 RepID=UPI003413339C
MDIPQGRLDDLVQAINDLHAATVRDEDVRLASEAAADLHSGSGYLCAPTEVLEAFTRALEAGYAAALQDMRRGKLDAEIQGWRPALFDGE